MQTMIKLIAETAWHHEGDFDFMKNLVSQIARKTSANIIKMHITLDLDEYMHPNHDSYNVLKSMLFCKDQWRELIEICRAEGKEIMLLLNDNKAIDFGISLNPEYVEIHSVCLNDLFLLKKLKQNLTDNMKVVLGVGGSSIDEIKFAINFLSHANIILMFGFQNYPTILKDVNVNKIRRLMKLFEKYEYGYADHTAWDSEHNELITLLGAANGMTYIEKHVTTQFGKKRIDWPAAVSLEMFNELSNKIDILNQLNGNGSLSLNPGELDYSVYGPMKKAAVLKVDMLDGAILTIDKIKFVRTKEATNLSQLDIINSIGMKINKNLKKETILIREHLIK